MTLTTIDEIVRDSIAKRMEDISVEYTKLGLKMDSLHSELTVLEEQYKCPEHDWVSVSLYHLSMTKCNKCGAEYVE